MFINITIHYLNIQKLYCNIKTQTHVDPDFVSREVRNIARENFPHDVTLSFRLRTKTEWKTFEDKNI